MKGLRGERGQTLLSLTVIQSGCFLLIWTSRFVPEWSAELEKFGDISFSLLSARLDSRMMLKKVRFKVGRRNFLRFACFYFPGEVAHRK